MAVSYAIHDPSFNNHTVNDSGLPPLPATIPMQSQLASVPTGVNVLYYIHQPGHNPSLVVGTGVISIDCPPFVPDETPNLFGRHYRIEFFHKATHTFGLSLRLNLTLANDLVMRLLTKYCIHLTPFVWMLPCQDSHLCISLMTFSSIAAIFGHRIASYLTLANMPPLLLLCKHSSTTPSFPNYLLPIRCNPSLLQCPPVSMCYITTFTNLTIIHLWLLALAL